MLFGGYLLDRPDAMSLVPAFVLNLLLSLPSYLLFRVCGPSYAFPSFPALPSGPVVPHPVFLTAPPNGIRSIHFSMALLFWYGRKLPFGCWITGIYLLLTAIATTASGEHYVFALVVAVPYAILICYWETACRPFVKRLRVSSVNRPPLSNPQIPSPIS